jgi:glycosyltransferase involved in cell wall biosynthesis
MRVLFLTAGGSWSGVEVHTTSLARALRDRGHDVAIVELGQKRFDNPPYPLPCPVIQLRLGPEGSGEVPLESVGFRLWKQKFSSLRADVVISVKGTFQFCNLAMEAAGRLCFPCFLVIEHYHSPLGKRTSDRPFGWSPPSLGLWWYRQKFTGFLRSIFPQKVVCVSEALARSLKSDYHYPASKLVVAYSGVDTNVFAPSPLARTRARNAWGIPEQAFVFGTLGRLSPMKNHHQLINAFTRLCRSSNKADVRLVVVGDGPLRPALESLAASEGVRQRITFAGFTTEPQNICQGFDVFCFPSTIGESLGIALLEAMSCGCPPIAAAVGGVPEILNDPGVGWLVPSGDESELYSAMRDAMNLDRGALRQKGAKARERVISDFNAVDRWAELVTVVEDAFQRAAPKPRALLGSRQKAPR